MPYTRESIPADHTEFGGGPGLIDPVMRADRNLTQEEQLIEIYATDPAGGVGAHGSTPEEIELRRAEGELHSKPETAVIHRP